MCLWSQAGLCGSWLNCILLQFQLPEKPRGDPFCSCLELPQTAVLMRSPHRVWYEGAATGLGGEKPEPARADCHSRGFCSCRHILAGLLEAARTLAMNSVQSIPLCMTPVTAGDTRGGWEKLAETYSRDSLLKKEDFTSILPPHLRGFTTKLSVPAMQIPSFSTGF